MFKYYLTAALLKGFSSSRVNKRIYRRLGNTIGARKRASAEMPEYYFDRIIRILSLNKRHRILDDGMRLLEIGTGWLHWEAVTARLFFNIQATLYDVWDNRQLIGLINYLKQLDVRLDKLDMEDTRLSNAHQLIHEITKVHDFNELYELLGFEYVLDNAGGFKNIEKGFYDLVLSAGVMEHVHSDCVLELLRGIARVLKPGGYSFHSINLMDHLYAYDRSVSPKQYIRYTHSTWRRWFENDVQYINKLQPSDWLSLFRQVDLILIEEERKAQDLAGLKPASCYLQYDESELNCIGLLLLHRKPQNCG